MKKLAAPKGLTSGRFMAHIRDSTSMGEVVAVVELLDRLGRVRIEKAPKGYAVLFNLPNQAGVESIIGMHFNWSGAEKPTASDGVLLSKTTFEFLGPE